MLDRLRRSAVAVAACLSACLISGVALAADAVAGTDTTVTLANTVTAVEGTVFTAVAAILSRLGYLVVKDIRAWLGMQTTTANTVALNAAINTALGWARNRLDEALQGKETIDVHNQLAATVGQRLVNEVPHLLEFFGLDETGIEDKVVGLLGGALPPIQTVETPAPAAAPAAPTTNRDDLLAQLRALLDSAPSPSPVAAAPVVAPQPAA